MRFTKNRVVKITEKLGFIIILESLFLANIQTPGASIDLLIKTGSSVTIFILGVILYLFADDMR